MKILHIVTDDNTADSARKVIDLLNIDGIEQKIVAPPASSLSATLAKADMQVDSKPLSWPFLQAQKFLLNRLIKREKPDIVQCWTRRAAAMVPYTMQKRLPIIGWVAGMDHPYYYRTCGHIVGATQPIADFAIGKGMAANCVHYIPSCPDVRPLPSVDRASFSTPRDAKLLLSLSKLHPSKGIDLLLQALKNLPNCWLWLAGDGPSRRDLEALAVELGVIDRVRFLGTRADRTGLLRAADLCVLPSRQELAGSDILEAWAAGTPVIAAANDGAKALIENDTTGVLTPIGDIGALTEAINALLSDSDRRRRLVAQGYAAYIKDFTREAVTHQWLALYQELTTRGPLC